MSEVPSAQAVAALAVVTSLVATLLERGLIDQAAVDAALKEAGTNAQALCADCPPEVERDAQHLLKEIGKTTIEAVETPLVPLVDPA